MSKRSVFVVVSAILAVFGASELLAQATRTWVSGVGDDANPCSRTAPCKTFAGAISKTAAGGEISVLDPGGFGALTVTKSISVVAEGTLGGVLAAGTNGIVINAGVNDVVVLRNLIIEGAGTGLTGIRFLAGGALHVEKCTIQGFQKGIDFLPGAVSSLFVKDTIIRKNPIAGGVLIKPGPAGSASASLDHVRMEGNLFGLRAEDRSKVTVRDSVAAGNSGNGILAFSAGANVEINIESSVSANNAGVGGGGVSANGVNATMRLSNVTIVNNLVGINVVGGATVASFQNNRIAGNTTNGTPTAVLTQQ